MPSAFAVPAPPCRVTGLTIGTFLLPRTTSPLVIVEVRQTSTSALVDGQLLNLANSPVCADASAGSAITAMANRPATTPTRCFLFLIPWFLSSLPGCPGHFQCLAQGCGMPTKLPPRPLRPAPNYSVTLP